MFLACKTYEKQLRIEKTRLSHQVWSHGGSTLKKRTLNGHFSRPAETDPYMRIGCNGRGCNSPNIQTIESPFHRILSPHSLKEEVGVLFSLDQANTSTIVQTHQLRTSQFEAKKTELD